MDSINTTHTCNLNKETKLRTTCICNINQYNIQNCKAQEHDCSCYRDKLSCRKEFSHRCICRSDMLKCKAQKHDCNCLYGYTLYCKSLTYHLCACYEDTSDCIALDHKCICNYYGNISDCKAQKHDYNC